jgi:hypothetical protein
MRDPPPNMTDYLETRSTFRLEVPEVYNYARDVVDAWAAREPDKLALRAVGPDGGDARHFSFADLAASSDRAANFLTAQGVRKSDRVLVMLPRIPEWYDVVLGCIKLGAVPMPATTLLTPRDVAYRITQAEASLAVVDGEGTSKVNLVADDCPSLRHRIYVAGGGWGGLAEGDGGRGWTAWAEGLAAAEPTPPDVEPTRSDDPMLCDLRKHIGVTSDPVATVLVAPTKSQRNGSRTAFAASCSGGGRRWGDGVVASREADADVQPTGGHGGCVHGAAVHRGDG